MGTQKPKWNWCTIQEAKKSSQEGKCFDCGKEMKDEYYFWFIKSPRLFKKGLKGLPYFTPDNILGLCESCFYKREGEWSGIKRPEGLTNEIIGAMVDGFLGKKNVMKKASKKTKKK